MFSVQKHTVKAVSIVCPSNFYSASNMEQADFGSLQGSLVVDYSKSIH